MRISELPVVDVREAIRRQRERLLGLIGSLGQAQWNASTAAPAWTVKDVVLHLLGGELSWLARTRDGEMAGLVPMSTGHAEFVRGLDQHNQRWVDAARMLSPQLIIDLLQWSGEQFDRFLGTVDLTQPSSVYWAGDAPLWFDLAREFTERWVHYQQIREAACPGPDDTEDDRYLPLVLRTFVWGFPHQYRPPAPDGTTVALEIRGIGSWALTRAGGGWILDEVQTAAPAASLRMTGDAAWRLLTGARYNSSAVQLSGDQNLADALLAVRGIIV